jgi:Protein of unknown function (DUF3309)
MGLILLIVVVLLLFGSAPVFPYSRNWGYRGPGIFGLLLVVLVVMLVMNVIPWGYGPGVVR